MPPALSHLLCPACGQSFLATQQHSLSVQVCPHCAFTSASGQFQTLSSPNSSAVDMRRRQPRFAPTSTTLTAVNPSAWEVRTFHPIVPAPLPELSATGRLPTPSRHTASAEANWEATQVYAEGRSTSPLAPANLVAANQTAEFAVESAPLPNPSAKWAPMKPGNLPQITPWQGSASPIGAGDSADDFVPRKRRNLVWPFIALISVAMIAGVIALGIQEQRTTSFKAQSKTSNNGAKDALDNTPTIKAAIPVVAPRVLPPESKLTLQDASTQVESLLRKLAAATNTDDRLACLAGGERHRQSVESYFSTIDSPLNIERCKGFPASVQAMPGGIPMILCEVKTNRPGSSTALTRLLSTSDGELKLDWPLLYDSLSGRLASYSAEPQSNPEWVTLGLRRNFGFDESETLREEHYIFDIQTQGNGEDRTVALVTKNSPTGRALNQAISWNQLYIVRTLLHYATIEGHQRLVIIDAELLPTGEDQL